MCFYISKSYPNPFVLDFHVLCKKVLKYDMPLFPKEYCSPYRNERYKFGVIKSVPRFGKRLGGIEIHQGLHSYAVITTPLEYPALIPAGTPFYYNSINGEYVSLKLVVFENLNSLKTWAGVSKINPAYKLPTKFD